MIAQLTCSLFSSLNDGNVREVNKPSFLSRFWYIAAEIYFLKYVRILSKMKVFCSIERNHCLKRINRSKSSKIQEKEINQNGNAMFFHFTWTYFFQHATLLSMFPIYFSSPLLSLPPPSTYTLTYPTTLLHTHTHTHSHTHTQCFHKCSVCFLNCSIWSEHTQTSSPSASQQNKAKQFKMLRVTYSEDLRYVRASVITYIIHTCVLTYVCTWLEVL